MTAILRAGLLAAFVAASIPALAAGQDTSTASLLRRIELLERANTDLEQRVRELESLIKSAPSQSQPIPSPAKWQDLANWRRLRRGMSMDQVRALLGEPERVDAGYITLWRWAYANVQFANEKLDGWSEPNR
jgi:hypothetical protein